MVADGTGHGHWANLDDGLRRLVLCHINKECLVAETNTLFGSPGEDSHTTCFEAKQRLPCSSCLDSKPYLELSHKSPSLVHAACAPVPFDELSASMVMLSTDTSTISDPVVDVVQGEDFINSNAPNLCRK